MQEGIEKWTLILKILNYFSLKDCVLLLTSYNNLLYPTNWLPAALLSF